MFAVALDKAKLFASWMWKHKDRVNFDATSLAYPRTAMAVVSQGETPIMMMPVHPVLVVEAMATRPETDRRWLALGLWRMHEQLDKIMKDTGMYEAYFVCNDANEITAVTRRGWEILLFDEQRKTWLVRRRIAQCNESL